MFIIIYNAETDFIVATDEAQVSAEIKVLLSDGYAHNDIELYEADSVPFEIKYAGILVTLKEKEK